MEERKKLEKELEEVKRQYELYWEELKEIPSPVWCNCDSDCDCPSDPYGDYDWAYPRSSYKEYEDLIHLLLFLKLEIERLEKALETLPILL